MNALAKKPTAVAVPVPTTEELRARDYPEILLDYIDTLTARGVKKGKTTEQAREDAFEAAEEWREGYGGEQIYIAKGRYFTLSGRDRKIYDRWNGKNTHLLCQEFDVTERHIYRIVEAVRKEEMERRQGKLFTPSE